MTDEIRAWRETLTAYDTEVAYYESAIRQKGKKREDTTYLRARLAAVTCGRDAIARKLTRMMEAEVVS